MSTRDGSELVMPRLIVPAYFHPASRPAEWAWLAEQPEQIRLVVLNLADGPGAAPDEVVGPALGRLRAAGVPVAGYVDTNYGLRPAGDALADLGRYLDWYKVAGVFFDRAAPDAEHVRYYAGLAHRARQLGAQVVALNHGAHPVEAYAEHADLLGTFEGPWRAYLDLVGSLCERLDVSPPPGGDRARQADIYRAEAALRERGVDLQGAVR